MCEWGNSIQLNVLIPANLSHTGNARWEEKDIDKCIAPIVDALNKASIFTASCCCGHRKELGHIWLQDGRILIIASSIGKDELMQRLKCI